MIRPPKPERALMKPPRTNWLTPVRQRLKRAALQVVDHGWLGYVPLEAHLVICGFPRSGTTLLQLMAETAYPSARTFGVERSGLAAANTTEILRVYHLDRGYEHVETKLSGVGADIRRVKGARG